MTELNLFLKRKRQAIEIHEDSTRRKEKRFDEQQLTTCKQQYSGNEISLALSYIVQTMALFYNIQTSLIGCVILRYYKLFFHAALSLVYLVSSCSFPYLHCDLSHCVQYHRCKNVYEIKFL